MLSFILAWKTFEKKQTKKKKKKKNALSGHDVMTPMWREVHIDCCSVTVTLFKYSNLYERYPYSVVVRYIYPIRFKVALPLAAVRQWVNVDQDLCRDMVELVYDELWSET